MDETGSNFGSILGWKAGTILVILHAFGWAYSWLVYVYLPRKNIRSHTAELVIGGVLVTVLGYGLLLGWNTVVLASEALIALLGCFMASGLPMVIGYWSKDAQEKAQDEARARQQFKKASQTVKKDKA